jgi:hypothetical protein
MRRRSTRIPLNANLTLREAGRLHPAEIEDSRPSPAISISSGKLRYHSSYVTYTPLDIGCVTPALVCLATIPANDLTFALV